MPFDIKFAADVRQHLEALTARERSTALEALERQLLHEPLLETRNRKPLRPTRLLLGSYESESSGSSMKSFLATLASFASWP
jgi:hypothetical protein